MHTDERNSHHMSGFIPVALENEEVSAEVHNHRCLLSVSSRSFGSLPPVQISSSDGCVDQQDSDMGEGRVPSKVKVMVIDDSKTIRRTAETLLRAEGCAVMTATDGFDALAKIVNHRPDIIFVDIMMPRLDGYQTCALIKNHQIYKTIPVIMLSSRDGLFDRAKGRVVGSNDYLAKPFCKEEVLELIATYCRTAD
jgi:twitching motility two-component system response regulator PilG